MATEFLTFQGKVKWVRVQAPNPWGKWTVTLYPVPADLERIRELQAQGLKNIIKKDDDGYNITFSRPQSSTIKGKVIGFAPPELLEADGKTPLRGVNVGNGSDCTVKVEVYSHGTPGGGKAKAARLHSIRVDNLVPFEMSRDFEQGGDQERMVRGMDEVPAPLF